MIRKLLTWCLAMLTPPAPTPAAPTRRHISATAIAASRVKLPANVDAPEITRYEPAPGVLPPGVAKSDAMAMDSTDYGYLNTVYCGQYFKGYPALAMLTQQPEFRKITETFAKEMTRKWIRMVSNGDDDKSEKIKAIEKALKKHKVRKLFRKALELDGFFGRGQIFIDVAKPGTSISAREDPEELKTPLLRDKAKIAKGALLGFKLVEPVWTYPSSYNGSDPLAPNYYRPSSWYVMGKEIHGSRLLLFVTREVPDLLKAAYNFGGLPMSQMAEPYVDNWLRTRDSVSDLLHSFSLSGIATDMSSALNGGNGDAVFARAELFNNNRDNRGLLMLDKESEEFFQFNTPLSGIDALQAQSQEQMASVSSIPLVKLLGITPAGLNANSDGEIRVFYDDVNAKQEAHMREQLEAIIEIEQLDLFGEIDPDISFEFVPLMQMNETEQAAIRKMDADTDAVLIAAAVLSPDDSRARIVNEPGSQYHAIELNPPDIDDDLDDDHDNKE